jgi:hypothetical protein
MSSTEQRQTSRSEWAQQSDDPDLEEDLGYELDDWEMVEARKAERDHLLFLPNDEEMIKEEAFLVIDPDIVCDLSEKT